MAFGRGQKVATDAIPPTPEPVAMVDDTAWMVDNSFAEFVLMNAPEIKYMCMVGYTFYLGNKVFGNFKPTDSTSFRFVQMFMACTGGGIIVPIFINAIPVPLMVDAYPIAITFSFLIHSFFPVVRDVMKLSPVFKTLVIVFYESLRAYVVVSLTYAASNAISPSSFSFPVFGPIMCGAIAGCGGAFLPLNKGLDPIKSGLAPNMLTALVAAAGFHLFLNSPFSEGVVDAKAKAHVHVSVFFILSGISTAFDLFSKTAPPPAKPTTSTVVVVPEKKKDK